MIRDSIQSTAGSFENMGYYQRIYMAKAAGLKDVGELALMMSGNYELLDENNIVGIKEAVNTKNRMEKLSKLLKKLNKKY